MRDRNKRHKLLSEAEFARCGNPGESMDLDTPKVYWVYTVDQDGPKRLLRDVTQRELEEYKIPLEMDCPCPDGHPFVERKPMVDKLRDNILVTNLMNNTLQDANNDLRDQNDALVEKIHRLEEDCQGEK